MPTPEDFPPTTFMGVRNEQGGRIASIHQLTPMFHRPPTRDWGQLYRFECEQSPSNEWHDAGFATCKVGEQTTVIDALTAAAAAADARYIAYLRSLQPEEAARIVQAEIASEKAVGTDGPFLLLTY